MARLAAGDEGAAIALYREFGGAIRAAVARRARQVGAYHLSREDIESMALDFCFELARRAGAWDPDGGALPWVWAVRLLCAVVDRYVGQYCVPLGEHHEPEDPTPTDTSSEDADAIQLLDRLARRDGLCALLRAALERVATPRDRAIFLEHAGCRAGGDPSPSHTVGGLFDLAPPAVRKVVERVRKRLWALAADEPEFAPLAELPLLAPRRNLVA